MAARFKLKEKVIAFFKQNSDQQATCDQIAEWIVKTYPDDCAKKIANSTRINNKDELPSTISSEINIHFINFPSMLLSEGLERVKINGIWGFHLTKSTSNTETINSNSSSQTINTNLELKTNKNIDEEDMYKPLREFLSSKHGIHFWRIEHRNAKKRGQNGDICLYPDLVGLEGLSTGGNDTRRTFAEQSSNKIPKFWSFYLKKEITTSTVDQCFSQAVSNSSWANFGYLVACEIDDESLKELRILSSSHRIGFIKLIIENPQASEIIIPAEEKKEIDRDRLKKLTPNRGFQKYISLVNKNSQNLLERFKVLIKDTELFDVLVGYFYTSGFHALYESLETTKKIRILIGISTNKETENLIQTFQEKKQYRLQFSHAETKRYFSDLVAKEIECCKDEKPVEDGIIKFMEWLENGKLEIRAYPTKNLHAKLYIMSFPKDDRDKDRVITGSSNFSQSGLIDDLEFNVEPKNPSDHHFAQDKFNKLWIDDLEFNVELKNLSDHHFAQDKFNKLWDEAVDVKEQYIETIRKRTWLNNDISPYELYLKFLYEYFKDELNQADEISLQDMPEGFKRLKYQEQAVLNAKKILNEYGGVFLSDVVGLGKTYMSAMLAKQLPGRTLVIAPPILLDEKNPGSWKNVFRKFEIFAAYESIGKLDNVIEKGTKSYENVFIDESHRFRTDTNITFEKIARICRGKKVVLVTATPQNNKPSDILSQIRLFQPTKNSTIPNRPDLEGFFKSLDKKLEDKKKDPAQYISTAQNNAQKIRESVLKYLIVRRTRTEIKKYFTEDLANQKIEFPKVADPKPLYYQFNSKQDDVFNETIEIVSQELKYARYKALTYYTGPKKLQQAAQSQENLSVLMKIMLIKRLESSFYAFKKSIKRFISYYESFIKTFDDGYVYISKYINQIIGLSAEGDEEAIQKLLDKGKAEEYLATNFRDDFRIDLENDLKTLQELSFMWQDIGEDPKLEEFINKVTWPTEDFRFLKKNKLIVFTESKETAEYLHNKLKDKIPAKKDKALLFTSSSKDKNIRTKIIENFDANFDINNQKDDYRILVTTEVLSEGVNLHRSNVVINYDIPWNPTRLMQRVGRVNRIDTKFKEIYTCNFFPPKQSDGVIQLKKIAKSKIQAFISLLGVDARHLTEDETIESHELFFKQLSDKETIVGKEEQESELKYLKVIKDIKNTDPDLFTKIEQLPKKARTAQKDETKEDGLLTYFRKGKLQKFYLTGKAELKELDFIQAAKLLEAKSTTLREDIPKDFYDKLEKNKNEFLSITSGKEPELQTIGQNKKLLEYLKATQNNLEQCSEEQKSYLKKVIQKVEDGSLPSKTIATTLGKIEAHVKGITEKPDSREIIPILQDNIAKDLLDDHATEKSASTKDPREVILSEYLIGN